MIETKKRGSELFFQEKPTLKLPTFRNKAPPQSNKDARKIKPVLVSNNENINSSNTGARKRSDFKKLILKSNRSASVQDRQQFVKQNQIFKNMQKHHQTSQNDAEISQNCQNYPKIREQHQQSISNFESNPPPFSKERIETCISYDSSFYNNNNQKNLKSKQILNNNNSNKNTLYNPKIVMKNNQVQTSKSNKQVKSIRQLRSISEQDRQHFIKNNKLLQTETEQNEILKERLFLKDKIHNSIDVSQTRLYRQNKEQFKNEKNEEFQIQKIKSFLQLQKTQKESDINLTKLNTNHQQKNYKHYLHMRNTTVNNPNIQNSQNNSHHLFNLNIPITNTNINTNNHNTLNTLQQQKHHKTELSPIKKPDNLQKYIKNQIKEQIQRELNRQKQETLLSYRNCDEKSENSQEDMENNDSIVNTNLEQYQFNQEAQQQYKNQHINCIQKRSKINNKKQNLVLDTVCTYEKYNNYMDIQNIMNNDSNTILPLQ